jgi:hypothetical protein
MLNPYIIILGLFIIAGLVTTLWGLRIILKARKTQHWPHVDGIIEESRISSDHDDLLPHIQFRYSVDQTSCRQTMTFSGDITPTQEFAASYVQKYPAGSKVQVYYNPEDPNTATLEPGLGKGDWLVFAMGLGMLLFGIIFSVVGG